MYELTNFLFQWEKRVINKGFRVIDLFFYFIYLKQLCWGFLNVKAQYMYFWEIFVSTIMKMKYWCDEFFSLETGLINILNLMERNQIFSTMLFKFKFRNISLKSSFTLILIQTLWTINKVCCTIKCMNYNFGTWKMTYYFV